MSAMTARVVAMPPRTGNGSQPYLRAVTRPAPACSTCKSMPFCLACSSATDSAAVDALVTQRIRLRKGESLVRSGDAFTGLFAVRSGSCKTVVTTTGGQEQIAGYHIAGDILGAQANLWTEYIATPHHVEYMLFPRLLAFSESVWSPASGKDYEDFMRRLPYQLGRLDKQAVHYRIPEPVGLEDFYTTTEDHAVVELRSLVAGGSIHYTLDGSDPTNASPRYETPLQIPLPSDQKTTLNVLVTAPVGRRSVVYGATFLRRTYLDAISGVVPQPGLSFALFEGTFTTVHDIERGIPVSTGISSSLDLGQFGRAMKFGVRFEGYIEVEVDGFYRFAVESDDGAVLRIDDEVVVDNDGNHGPQSVIGHIPLRRGLHKFSLRYYQSEGGAALSVGWADEDGELQPLAGPALFH